jgi:excinuclease UvrABC nuclease subunit
MKPQDNCCPSKAYSITKDLNNCEQEEVLNVEFQKIIAKMTNNLKEETQRLVSDLKKDVDKQLKELKENTSR